ncbi:MAG: hypothetical protein NT125_04550 [Candidatus Bipolaricaulota bacterium]|nr:hypothetical protein [Candidatus Bipolaricaulota bacterium]
MYTREELTRILGLSYKQLRIRLDHLAREGNLLQRQVVKGPNGRLDYSPAVIEMLRDLGTLAQEPGKDNGQGARELAKKIRGNGNGDGQGGKADNREALEVEVSYLKQMVEELRRERDTWREVALDMKNQLALPRPKEERPRRRRWLPWRSRN